ncbi:amino acid permease [Levilactobacillus brevis]
MGDLDYRGDVAGLMCMPASPPKTPQQGGPIAYAGEISPAFGFQTGVLYYHANWIGNLAIGITAVSYLSTFFPALNNPVPAGIACIAIVWVFTFVNMLGGTWVSRLTTLGLVLARSFRGSAA